MAACLKASNRDGGPFELVSHNGETGLPEPLAVLLLSFTCDTV